VHRHGVGVVDHQRLGGREGHLEPVGREGDAADRPTRQHVVARHRGRRRRERLGEEHLDVRGIGHRTAGDARHGHHRGRRGRSLVGVAIDRRDLIRVGRDREDVAVRIGGGRRGADRLAIAVDDVVIDVAVVVDGGSPAQGDRIRIDGHAAGEVRRRGGGRLVDEAVGLARRAAQAPRLPIDGIVAVLIDAHAIERRAGAVRLGGPGGVVLEVHVVDTVIGDVSAERVGLADLEQLDRVAVVAELAAVHARHGNAVRGNLVTPIEGRVVAHQHQVGAGPQRGRSAAGPRGGQHRVVYDDLVVRLLEPDLIGDGPVVRVVAAAGENDGAGIAERVRAQQDPAVRIRVGEQIVVLVDGHQRGAAGVADAILSRVVQLPFLAFGVEEVVAGEDLVSAALKGAGGPGGRGARLQGPGLVREPVRIVPAEGEADPVAYVEVAERLRSARAVVDLEELEILGVVAGGGLGEGGGGRVIHDLVERQPASVRRAVGRAEGGSLEQGEVRPAGRFPMEADGNAVRRGAEVDMLAVPPRRAGRIRAQVRVVAVLAEGEGDVGARIARANAEVAVFRQHEVIVCLDPRVGGDLVLGQIFFSVAEEPPADVDGLVRRVVQLDHVAGSGVLVRENLGDDDRAGRDERVLGARGAAGRGAGAPAFAGVPEGQRSERIADGEREALAVGLVVPAVLILEQMDDAAHRCVQLDLFARVVQAARVHAGDDARADAAVAVEEGGLVAHDHFLFAGRDRNAVGEREGNPVAEPQPAQRERLGADVLDLDELEVVAVRVACGDLGGGRGRRVIHDLGDANRRGQIDVVGRLVQRAPHAASVRPRLHVRVAVERDRAVVHQGAGADRAAGQARIAAVEAVVDRSGRGRDAQRRAGLERPAVLLGAVDLEAGGLGARVEPAVAQLLDQGPVALRQVGVEDPVALVLPVGGLVGRARDHVAPAGRLRADGGRDLVGQGLVAGDGRRRGQCAAVEQVLVGAVRKQHLEVDVHAEPIVGLGGVVAVGRADARHVPGRIANPRQPHGHLRVPGEELEAGAGRAAGPGRVVVVPGPVGVGHEEVHQEVVDEVGNVEQAFRGGVVRAVGKVPLHPLVGGRAAPLEVEAHQARPGLQAALAGGPARVHAVPLLLVAAQVGRRKRRVGPLHRVVHAPVQAVDVEVHERAVRGGAHHGQQRPVGELVADELGLGAPPRPAVVEIRAQHDRVELVGGLIAEERELELRGPVDVLEEHPQRVLLVHRLAPHAAVHAEPGVDLEFTRAVGIEVLERNGPLPAIHGRVGVNPGGRVEQIGLVRHDRHRRQRQQRLLERVPVGRIADDLRVHLIVGRRAVPGGRETNRRGRLGEDVAEEDVGLRVHVRRRKGRLERRRPHRRGPVDRDRPGVGVVVGLGGDRARGRRGRRARHRVGERVGAHVGDDEQAVVLRLARPADHHPIAARVAVVGDRRGGGRAVAGDARDRLRIVGWAGRRAVERVANGRPRGRRGDAQQEGLIVEPPVLREMRVLHTLPVLLRVGRTGRGSREVMLPHALVDDLGELGQEEHVAVARRVVQDLHRQHIARGLKQAEVLRDVDVLEGDGLGVGPLPGGLGVVGDRGRGVAARDLHSVQVGDVAVVVLHLQREGIQRLRVGHVERDAGVERGVVGRLHRRLDVRADQAGEGRAGATAGEGLAEDREAAVGRIAHQAEAAVPRGIHSGGGEELDIGPAAPLVERQFHAVVAGSQIVDDAEGIVGPSRREELQRVAVDGRARLAVRGSKRGAGDPQPEAVVAVDPEGPGAGGGEVNDPFGPHHEIVVIGAVGHAGEGIVGREVSAPARVFIVDNARRLSVDGTLVGRGVDDRLRDRQVGDGDARLVVPDGQSRHQVGEPQARRPVRPGGVAEARLHPRRLERAVGRHEPAGVGPGRDELRLLDLLAYAVGDVVLLAGVGRRVLVDHVVRGVVQAEVLPRAPAELEVGVQLGRGQVPVGGEDDAALARAERHRRERPRLAAVLELPAGEVDGLRVRVVDLDPVLEGPLIVAQPIDFVRVAGEELADDGREDEPRFEDLQQSRPQPGAAQGLRPGATLVAGGRLPRPGRPALS